MNTKDKNSCFLFLSLSCIFFSVNSSPINPAYIIGGGLIAILILHLLNNFKLQRLTFITLIFALLLLISQIIGIKYMRGYPEGVNYLTPVLFCYSIIISACTSEALKIYSFEERVPIYKKVYSFSIFFLSLELITRLINFNGAKDGFYSLKFSLFYFDSNFTGLVILALCSFLLYLKSVQGYDLKIHRRILYFLLLATFSRAAIAALIITRIGLSNHRKVKSRSYIMLAAAGAIFTVMALEYIYQAKSFAGLDGSFNSKFYIISKALSFYQEQDSMIHYFGIGLGNTSQFIGIFAHNMYVTLILEMGFVGTTLFLLFIAYTLKISKGYTMYIWLPVFISGVSLFSAYSPFIFIISTLICCESILTQGNKNA